MTIDEFKDACREIRGWQSTDSGIRDADGYCPICAVARAKGLGVPDDPIVGNFKAGRLADDMGLYDADIIINHADTYSHTPVITVTDINLRPLFRELVARDSSCLNQWGRK